MSSGLLTQVYDQLYDQLYDQHMLVRASRDAREPACVSSRQANTTPVTKPRSASTFPSCTAALLTPR